MVKVRRVGVAGEGGWVVCRSGTEPNRVRPDPIQEECVSELTTCA